ncbi:MAG: hypothetical protein OJF47_002362 [Nitrospira sp.]|nr:MAG: hypothetical protein OJF47_002362 [Nitrospira sp.]
MIVIGDANHPLHGVGYVCPNKNGIKQAERTQPRTEVPYTVAFL